MTLRKLIDEVGMCEKDLKKLKKQKAFKLIKNLDIVTADNITNWNLIEYFDSKRFSEDISEVAENINKLIKSYPNLKPKNFFLYILSHTPLKLEVKPLIG